LIESKSSDWRVWLNKFSKSFISFSPSGGIRCRGGEF
jgi:hypothetical protein